jgi:hypothetical protein
LQPQSKSAAPAAMTQGKAAPAPAAQTQTLEVAEPLKIGPIQMEYAPVESVPAQQKDEWADRAEQVSIRRTILERYRTGDSMVDIARELDLGLGEVKLIIELYKGDKNS